MAARAAASTLFAGHRAATGPGAPDFHHGC